MTRPTTTVSRTLLLVATLFVATACANADDVGAGSGASEEPAIEQSGSVESESAAMAGEAISEAVGDPAAEVTSRPELSISDELQLPTTGTLETVDVESGCLVLIVDGVQYELQAAPDAELAVDAANGLVVDAEGNELATAGDDVTVDGALDPGIATFCQVGPVLFVTEVTPA